MNSLIKVIFPLAALLLFVGCASTPPPPLYSKPGFQPQQMDKIHVLPVVDNRPDKKLTTNLDKTVHNQARHILKSKKYPLEIIADKGMAVQMTEDDIKQATPEWISQVGPTGSRWVMVFTVEELARKVVFGSTGNAEMTMVILDKANGTIAWRDKDIGRIGQGGLMGMFMVGVMDESAVQTAVMNLLNKLPKKPKQ